MNYTEQNFEEHIEEHLLQSGYDKGTPEAYDRDDLCLLPHEVITFIQNTQPKEWQKLEKQYGADASSKFTYRLSQEISKHGSLHVLRKGIKDRDAKLQLAYFKPASGMNPEHLRLYSENRFAIVRQVKYSKRNENSLDMVIFLNGIPIITMELKNSLTGQFVENAIKQYKKDRDPREPLFKFKRCLVHFAVGNEKVYMTTRLQGTNTRFLPFNKDTENPVNPNGHQTSYLWEDILQPDTLLSLIRNYLHVQKVSEKVYDKSSGRVKEQESEVFIFPRYHQLDCVRHSLEYVKRNGAGHDYLVQHSAGSGKSNSIAWLAHQLASLYQHETDTERLYVDKKLGGLHAVQTLSRLNRTMKGKDSSMILDFVNDIEDIQTAFQDYYQTTFLEEETDPNKLHNLHADLLDYEIFTNDDVEAFAQIFFNPKEPGERLQPILDSVTGRFRYVSDDDRREEFRSTLQSFVRLYGYISQIIDWTDTDLEKVYVFARNLNRKLPPMTEKPIWHIKDCVDLDSFRIQKNFDEISIPLEKEDAGKPGIGSGTRQVSEEEMDFLSNIVQTLNDTYGLDLTDEHKVDFEQLKVKLDADEELKAFMNESNTLENIRYKFDKVVDKLLLEFVHTKLDLYKKLTDPRVNALFKQKWFEGFQSQFNFSESS